MKRVPATLDFEKIQWSQGKKYVVGIDEVGRGAWAGPLVSAAVIFPANFITDNSFYDSKLLKPAERESLDQVIRSEAYCFGVGEVSVEEVNQMGLTLATQTSYLRALVSLKCTPDHYLIDAFYINSLPKVDQTPIIHGDQISATIAAASIVAKVYRDKLMGSLGKVYSQYKLEKNKGYGTRDHQEAIKEFGLSNIHRLNYNLKSLS